MNFRTFMDGIRKLEITANEFMTNVAIQVTNDRDGNHTATFMLRTPYSDAVRDIRVVVNPLAPDKLAIELNKEDDLFFNADAEGLYMVLWHAAESDFSVELSLKNLPDMYEAGK